jgi:putative endonuclease
VDRPACRQAGRLSNMYYVYIINCKTSGKFYTGITSNLIRRLAEHNKVGSGSVRYTKNLGSFKVVHLEECLIRQEARTREKYWKSGVGREVRDRYFI